MAIANPNASMLENHLHTQGPLQSIFLGVVVKIHLEIVGVNNFGACHLNSEEKTVSCIDFDMTILLSSCPTEVYYITGNSSWGSCILFIFVSGWFLLQLSYQIKK